jgi:hypothetical protein
MYLDLCSEKSLLQQHYISYSVFLVYATFRELPLLSSSGINCAYTDRLGITFIFTVSINGWDGIRVLFNARLIVWCSVSQTVRRDSLGRRQKN